MSFYTYYKYLGCLNHCPKNQLEARREEAEQALALMRQDLLMLVAASQPASGVIDLGEGPEPWMDYVTTRAKDILDEFESTVCDLVRYDQAIEVKERHPENITDESDGVDEHWGEELE